MSELSHFAADGGSRMVDVGHKPITERSARASARVRMAATTVERVRSTSLAKGDVLEVARLAGIMAAKKTAELIPLCHPLPLDSVEIAFVYPDDTSLQITATVRCAARTGVEMEAMTAVTVAALTVYDMVKGVDRGLEIGPVRLEEKSGGQSGHYQRPE